MAKSNTFLGIEYKFIALFAILAVAFYYGMTGTSPFGFSTSGLPNGIGANLISLSQVDIKPSDPNNQLPLEKVWLATVRFAPNGGQVLSSRFPATSLKSEDPTDKEVTTGYTDLTFTMSSQKIKWNVHNTNTHLYNVQQIPKNFVLPWNVYVLGVNVGNCNYNIRGDVGARPDNFPQGTCTTGVPIPTADQFAGAYEQYCHALSTTTNAVYKSVFINPNTVKEWYCYDTARNDLGNVYTLENPYIAWKATFTIDPQSQNPEWVDLNSETTLSASTNGWIPSQTGTGKTAGISTGRDMYVKWTGNSISNNLPPSGNEPRYLLSPSQTFTKIGSNNYAIPDFTTLNQITNGDPYTKLDNAISSYNTATNNLIGGQSNAYFSSSVMNKSANIIDSKVEVDVTTNPPFLPEFQIVTNAVWMGFYIPKGAPQILSSSCSGFSSGGYGSISANVVNNGDQTDFTAFASCAAPISGASAVQGLGTFAKGQQKPISVNIVGSPVTTTQNVACTLTVADAGDSTNKVTSQVTCSISPVCTLQPYGNFIIQTNNDGTCKLVCGLSTSNCGIGQTFDPNSCVCSNVNPTNMPCADGTQPNQCSLVTNGKSCVNGQLVTNPNCNVACPKPNQVRDATGNCVDQGGNIPTWAYILVGGAILLGGAYLYQQNQGKGKGRKRR